MTTDPKKAVEQLPLYRAGEGGLCKNCKQPASEHTGMWWWCNTLSRYKKMLEAGFTPRDRRLSCDECGAKFTQQFAPIHKCERQHSTTEHCWCEPTLDYVDPETGIKVWVHNRPQ
jgi:hypothetical protein